jgi:hypothetical protein
MSKELVKKFTLEIIKPVVKENFILMLDSWSGHKNYDQINDLNCKPLVIPPKITSLIQPADVFVFLQWKYFAKKMYNFVPLEEIDIDLRLRNYIIKMHSLIFNQLQSSLFYPMLKYAWYKPGYITERPENFETVKDICFKFDEIECSLNNCTDSTFVFCSWYRKCL